MVEIDGEMVTIEDLLIREDIMDISEFNSLNKRLVDSIDSKNLDEFDAALLDLFRKVRTRMFHYITKPVFDSLQFSDSEQVMFYIYASTRLENEEKKNSNLRSFRLEYVPMLFTDYINNNQDTFYNTLLNNIDVQREYAIWFRENGYIGDNDPKELFSKIFELDEFKTNLLSDSEIIGLNFSHSHDFFEIIPNDYAYLIALYDTGRDRTGEILEKLYQKKMPKELSETAKLELMKTQIQINTEPNIFNLGISDRMMEFEYCLKQITEDVTYYDALKDLSTKTGLDLKTIVRFASKYDGSIMFRKLCLSDEIDESQIEKIEYLAGERKVIDEHFLDDLDRLSMDDLKQVEKEDNKSIKSNLRGGPQSRTNERFFDDGFSREVIRIDSNGEIKKVHVSAYGSHEGGVLEIYNDNIPKEITTAIDRVVYAANNFSSVTLVIENEMCYFALPEDISEEQIDVLSGLFEKANPKGQVGVLSCNKDNNTYEILFNNSCVSPEQAIEFLGEVKGSKTIH